MGRKCVWILPQARDGVLKSGMREPRLFGSLRLFAVADWLMLIALLLLHSSLLFCRIFERQSFLRALKKFSQICFTAQFSRVIKIGVYLKNYLPLC